MSDFSVTPWTMDCQAPLSMGFPRQGYWGRLPFPSLGTFLTEGGTEPSISCIGRWILYPWTIWEAQRPLTLRDKEKRWTFKRGCRRRQVASVLSNSVRPHGLQPTRLLRPWDSPGKNTGVGCHFLLQERVRGCLMWQKSRTRHEEWETALLFCQAKGTTAG